MKLTVGETIHVLRRRKGLTMNQLALLAGCSVMTIRRIEAGEREGTFQTLMAIADALEVSIATLIMESEDEN